MMVPLHIIFSISLAIVTLELREWLFVVSQPAHFTTKCRQSADRFKRSTLVITFEWSVWRPGGHTIGTADGSICMLHSPGNSLLPLNTSWNSFIVLVHSTDRTSFTTFCSRQALSPNTGWVAVFVMSTYLLLLRSFHLQFWWHVSFMSN